MPEQLFILSYLSLPTDLAAEMHAWPEFVSGEGYAVELRGSTPEDSVSVQMDAEQCVVFFSASSLLFFVCVVGRVVHSLSARTESLLIRRG